MKQITLVLTLTSLLLTLVYSCSNNPTANTTADPTKGSVQNEIKENPTPLPQPAPPTPYNVLEKVNGSYSRIPGEKYQSDWGTVPQKVSIKIAGKNISINGDKYRFEKMYNKKDTLLTFGEVSEESGDFLGGGEVVINGDKVIYKMFYGTEAAEVFVFKKD